METVESLVCNQFMVGYVGSHACLIVIRCTCIQYSQVYIREKNCFNYTTDNSKRTGLHVAFNVEYS